MIFVEKRRELDECASENAEFRQVFQKRRVQYLRVGQRVQRAEHSVPNNVLDEKLFLEATQRRADHDQDVQHSVRRGGVCDGPR